MAVRVIEPSIKTGSNTKEPIKIPDTSVNGIENYQKIGSGVCYDTGTSDTAGTWTVSIPNITALTEGLTIKVRLKTSYNSTKNTLNVNGLGAKTVYFRYGTKLTSHYGKESVLALTYSANAIGSGTDTSGWIVENIYDSTNTYQLRVYNTRPKTKSALYRYMICFVNKDGLLIPANNVNNSTATTKTLTTESFNLFDSIYYYNSTTTISANGQVGTGTLYKQLGVSLAYSFNTGSTLVAPNGVYLKVTADGSQFKLATDNPITQSLPTSDDGYFYCYLGRAYSSTNIELVPEHPIYLYKNGIIQEYSAYIKSVADTALQSETDPTVPPWAKTPSKPTYTASEVGALSLNGGTINKSKTIKMDASANSDGANLKWGTVNSKNPYIGYASDQVDGTFVVGSLLGTNYASGLAIGGGSGNLLWKGTKVATINDMPNVSGKANLSGGNTFSGRQSIAIDNAGYVFDVMTDSQDCGTVLGVEKIDGGYGGASRIIVDGDGLGNVELNIDSNAGTAGQVLTSQGAGRTPQWSTPPKFSFSNGVLTITT